MGDSSSKKSSIPSWQLATTSADSSSASVDEKQDSSATPNETLIEQASRFLEDESIRDAPTDRKIAFLESKGLQNDDIHKLLGLSRNVEATATDDSKTETLSTPNTNTETDAPTSESSREIQNTEPSSSQQIPQPSQLHPASNTRRPDVPPVITYPEFMLQESKPPPLINLQTVLYTIYGAGAAAASIYGASEYLVKPMLESLTSARHELAETTQKNLQNLNEKLENNVSIIPPIPSKPHRATPGQEETQPLDHTDTESITSDPTELYHRDIATQTTADLPLSTPSSSKPEFTPDQSPPLSQSEKAIDKHSSTLQSITSQLKSVLSAENDAGTTHDTTRSRISELQTYLDSLTYSSPAYLNSTLYGVYGDDGSTKGTNTNGEDDAISAFKTEVRSVKGTLLSARNFPSGTGGHRGGVAAR